MERKASIRHNKSPDFLLELSPEGDKTSDLELDTSLYQADNVDKTIDEHALGILSEKNKQRDLNDLNTALVTMGYTKINGLENKALIKQLLEDNLRLNNKVNQLTTEKQTMEAKTKITTKDKTVKLKQASMYFRGKGDEISENDKVELSNAILELQDENSTMQSYIDELHEALEKEMYKVNELDTLNRNLNKEIVKNCSMVKVLKGKFIQPLYDFINGGNNTEKKENIEEEMREFIGLVESLEEPDMVKLIAKKTIINISLYKKQNTELMNSLDAIKKEYTGLKLENIEKTKRETLYMVRIRELKYKNKNLNESVKKVAVNMKNYKKVLKIAKEQIGKTGNFLKALKMKLISNTTQTLISFYFVCEKTLQVIKRNGTNAQRIIETTKNKVITLKDISNNIINSSNKENNKYKSYREQSSKNIIGLQNYSKLDDFNYNWLENNKEGEALTHNLDAFLSFLNSFANDTY